MNLEKIAYQNSKSRQTYSIVSKKAIEEIRKKIKIEEAKHPKKMTILSY